MWQCLIIEDDKDNARYLANGLVELGHAVKVCPDGVSGLDHAMKEHWDIIVLDRILPNNVDGLSILSTLRALGKTTPVLVLSALSAVDDRVDGLRAGGDDYLVKPFSFSELVARMDALVRRTRPRPEIKELRVADLVVNMATQKVTRAGRPITLQPQEFRLGSPCTHTASIRQAFSTTLLSSASDDILVADEAVSALDVSVQAQVLALLDEVRVRTGIAVLFITHDLRVAAQVCDSIMVMQHGRMVERGSAAQVLTTPKDSYTRALIHAAPGRDWDFRHFRPMPATAIQATAGT